MNIENIETEKLIPYEFNNRNHPQEQVDRIANSIKEFGFNQPIVVDESNIILVGHGRFEAAKKLGIKSVPVLKKLDLNETQKKAYRILDNKLQNDSTWNEENLKRELELLQSLDFQMSDFGLDELFNSLLYESEDSKYTSKIESPVYKPTQEKPEIEKLFDLTKYSELISKIKESEIEEQIKDFLIHAATRHIKFDYKNIAEYYAHSSKEVQELFEDSALVIIDFNKAIEDGFVVLCDEISEAYVTDDK